MAEQIVLDPSEVATSRSAFDITPWVKADGINWGDSAIAVYAAEAQRGEIPVDYRVPNRTITIPLVLKDVGGTAFETVRGSVQAKAALLQREGGFIKRITSSGGTVYADVTNATLRLGGGWSQAYRDYDIDGELVLEAIPDFYGDEEDLGDNVETVLPDLIFTDTNVRGDYPARTRIVVDEDDAEAQLGLLWAFRCLHYSSASTAALAYQAEALTVLSGSRTGVSGASGGTVVAYNTIGAAWTPVINTNLQAGTYLTHTGTYRVYARMYTSTDPATSQMLARFVWDVGDLTAPVENDPYAFTQPIEYELCDLGEIRLDRVPSGTHRWQGQLQFMAEDATGSGSVGVDRLYFVPLDEGAGKLIASSALARGLAAHVGRDEFSGAAGNLHSDVAAVGGAWSSTGIDAIDFTVETTGHTAQRSEVSDADTNSGRYAISGASVLAAQVVQIDFKATNLAANPAILNGVVARYSSSTSWFRAEHSFSAGDTQFRVSSNNAGAIKYHALLDVPAIVEGEWMTIALMVDAAGNWYAWFFPAGSSPGDPVATGYDPLLATGGALDDGKPGFYDACTTSVASTRNYDNFAAWAPQPDAVMYASQSLELRTEGVFREDSAGAAYGPVAQVIGDLPRLPVSGPEGRTVQTFIKATRGNFDNLPDRGIDDISARVFYRPCWLFVEGA